MRVRVPDGPCHCCKAVSPKRKLTPFGKTKRLVWLCKYCRRDVLAGRCPMRRIRESNRRLDEALRKLAGAGVTASEAARNLGIKLDEAAGNANLERETR